jgi:hypothetical protein
MFVVVMFLMVFRNYRHKRIRRILQHQNHGFPVCRNRLLSKRLTLKMGYKTPGHRALR